MVLHKIEQIELCELDINKIDEIKSLKNNIDTLCHELVLNLNTYKIPVETVQDIMFESGLSEIVGRVTVNRYIKNIYR